MTVSVSKPQLNLREELSALKKKSGIKGEELLRANTTSDVYNAIGGLSTHRNKVINGDMAISQRVGDNAFSLVGNVFNNPWTNYTPATGNYAGAPADRFMVGDNCGTGIGGSAQRVSVADASVPSNYALRWTRTSSGTGRTTYDSRFQYNVEGYSVADYKIGVPNATPMVVSFYARSNKPGRAYYWIWTDGSGSRYCQIPISLTTGWQRYVINLPGCTDASATMYRDHRRGFGTGLYWATSGGGQTSPVYWTSNATGSNIDDYSSSGDWIEFTCYQIEYGTAVTPFDTRPYAIELMQCQRYHWQLLSSGNPQLFANAIGNGNCWQVYLQTPVPMRANASVTVSAASTFGSWPMASGGTNVTGTSWYSSGMQTPGNMYLELMLNTSGGGTVDRFGFKSSTAYIYVSAEV